MTQELLTYRVDDLPILYSQVKKLNLRKSVDEHFQLHGNWVGSSPGQILELWICYILNQCDHRLSGTEEWAKNNLDLLKVLSDNSSLTRHDFSDDKLGLLLDYFSNTSKWNEIEKHINSSLLGVYHLESTESLKTFRLDAAPMQGYGKVKQGGLLQYGYHKHHANLPQFKLKLCTLDNAVNHFAYPICHMTVEGKMSDDELYIPIIAKSKEVLSGISAFESGNLYVGDSKFSSIGNRLYVHKNEDYYLSPLSATQLSAEKRRAIIEDKEEQDYEKVYRTEKKKEVLVAEGFEVMETIEVESEGKKNKWEERRLFVHSINYAKSQQKSLEKRLAKSEIEIMELTKRKQGKPILKNKQGYQQAINDILKTNKVENLLNIKIKESKTRIKKRAYGQLPKRVEIKSKFELFCQREEPKIERLKKYMGWQVYATNAPKGLLSFEKCVWKYRYQSNIESRFDDIRNKVAPLLPVFLQKDKRIKGLVNVLLLGLKICSMMEYQIAKNLQIQKELLKNVYEGNPNRGTARPSAKRILKAFEGITISVIFENNKLKLALMTNLKPVQKNILKLLGLDENIYNGLANKMKLFFSKQIIIET